MSGVNPRFSHAGPPTYQVAEAVKGGMLIEARAGGLVGKAAAGSTKVLGVARTDARPATNNVSTDSDGFEVINLSPIPADVAVDFGHFPVTYAANAAFGEALIAAANGTVTPAGATPDARTIVGYCSEPNGVVVATNAVGLANISR